MPDAPRAGIGVSSCLLRIGRSNEKRSCKRQSPSDASAGSILFAIELKAGCSTQWPAGIGRVAAVFPSGIPAADGIDCDLPALSPRDRLLEGHAARVVLAIADHDYDPGDRLDFRTTGQLVGGEGHRVPKGGSTPGCEQVRSMRGQCG